MTIIQNIPSYIKSLSRELEASANRVRDLIGDRHWLSDGHHKERLLAEALRRHIPRRYTVTTGFLLDQQNEEAIRSREQDIMILDLWRHPLLFGTDSLSISYSIAAVACVSVKSKLKKDSFDDSWDTLASVPAAPTSFHRVAFFFDGDEPTRVLDWARPRIESGTRGIDVVATTGDFFARFDYAGDTVRIRGFRTEGVSFGTMLAVLVAGLADGRDASDDLIIDVETIPTTLLFEEEVQVRID